VSQHRSTQILADRQLTLEEFRAYERAPMSTSERDGTLALVEWFCRRYPTPAERLAYVRRTYARWRRSRPPGSPPRRSAPE
jgi:hypothetical protein